MWCRYWLAIHKARGIAEFFNRFERGLLVSQMSFMVFHHGILNPAGLINREIDYRPPSFDIPKRI